MKTSSHTAEAGTISFNHDSVNCHENQETGFALFARDSGSAEVCDRICCC